jgi:adenylosuccinate lyase
MIARYQRKELKKIWSDDSKFKAFLKVELASSRAWHELGLFDEETLNQLQKASFKLKDIENFELETKHDVIAFNKAVGLSLGEEKKWFHYGLTSTDVVDTAQSLILKEVNQIIKKDIDSFMLVLKEKAYLYKDLPTIGRTHGIHAEITSFGLKFALWYEDFKRLRKLFIEASKEIEVAKLSGAVGNYSANQPLLQEKVANQLKLSSSLISTQTLQRDRHAHYVSVLALIGSELEKIAIEIRHLSRTEVGEVSEYFEINQKGSSAMPHKRNPISSENITGLSRVLRGYMNASFENIPLWHERDISHSSTERIILPDATTLIDYMLVRYQNTLKMLQVNEHTIKSNINYTYGVIYAQQILNMLIRNQMDREHAYELIQKTAFQALDQKRSFIDLINAHLILKPYLDQDEMKTITSVNHYLRYVETIYLKVFK